MNKTGGLRGEPVLKCRKLDYYGDAGDYYFEQPSMSVIESGLWHASGSSALPRITRIETVSRSSEFIDAIRFTYSRQAATGEESKTSGSAKTENYIAQKLNSQSR